MRYQYRTGTPIPGLFAILELNRTGAVIQYGLGLPTGLKYLDEPALFEHRLRLGLWHLDDYIVVARLAGFV